MRGRETGLEIEEEVAIEEEVEKKRFSKINFQCCNFKSVDIFLMNATLRKNQMKLKQRWLDMKTMRKI